ncbi:M20/M25/M40 family metallo-hydrolase, partial [bacterium]
MFALSLAMLALGGAPLQGPSASDQAVIDAIIREGKDNSQVMKKLTELCTKIGPRLTGSPRLTKAENWAMGEFRKLGLKNVHLDEWGEVPVGFDRGPNNSARLITPDKTEEMIFTTDCWTNGTNGVVRAEAVLCPDSVEAIETARESLGFGGGRGAGAGGAGGGLGGGNATPPQRPAPPQADLIAALDKLPIAGIVRGSRNELVITAGRWEGKTFDNHPGVPRIIVRKSDCDKIVYEATNGQKPILAIQADNRWYPGPVKQYNVVADLVGSEKPDELVIVSGHFDSWNGPGSLGTCDNGTGSMTAMEAARILTKLKVKPKRTIRFILWSGEEQGLWGSRGYVRNHPNELPKISAVLVDDGGTNYQGGYAGIASQQAIFESAYAPVVRAFPDMPQTFRVSERMPRGGGSDHASFNAVGVPGFFTNETGRSNYTYLHHTQHDNLSQA